MKIDFDLPNDDQVHTYCVGCLQETVETSMVDGHAMNTCTTCGYVDGRALIVDPAVKWWLVDDGEYWHEVAGVFVVNERDEMLFFERNRFPFGLTPPAGHVDTKNEPDGEDEVPQVAACRELQEETGIALPSHRFSHAATADIVGDGCRRGADVHRWHAFTVRVKGAVSVRVDESEGSRPVWLTLDQALARDDLTFATRYMLENYGQAIMAA